MHWRIRHLSPKTVRALLWWLGLLAVVLVAVVELVWMAQRVTDHRALRASQQSPPKVFSFPLSGFKP